MAAVVKQIIVLVFGVGLAACADGSRDVSNETPWVTSVDSTSD